MRLFIRREDAEVITPGGHASIVVMRGVRRTCILYGLFPALLIVLVQGCASYHPSPIAPAATLASYESRALDSLDLKRFVEANLHREVAPWPPRSWDFPLLSLAAFYYHPDMDVARAGWGVARAGVLRAGMRPNPVAAFDPQYVTNVEPGFSPWVLGFSFDIPLETAGKRGYRISLAGNLAEAARLNIATVAWQVRSRLDTRFLDLYTAGDREALLARQEVLQAEVVKLLEGRLAAGGAARPVVTQAHISLEQTRLLLKDAQRRGAEARAGLAFAIGIPRAALDGVDFSFDFADRPLPAPPGQDVRRRALTGRSDILALLSEYEASQATLQLEIARQYPDVHIGPGYIYDQGQNKWSLGLALTLPVFNRNQGAIAEAEARRKEVAARFNALQAQVIGQVDQALAGYRAALVKLTTADALLAAQRRQRQSTEALFNAGEADRLALLLARLELATTTLARADAFAQAHEARRLLEDALQQPLAQLQVPPGENARLKKENHR